jgi:hypothetical protein
MKTTLIVISVVLFLAIVLVLGGYAFFNYSLQAMHRKQTIAEHVVISSDWQEIKPAEPLEIKKQVQAVMLSIEGYESDIGNNDFGNIKLADGTKVNPEIQIVDENGKVYQLRDGKRVGNNIGFSVDKEIHGTYAFPKDVTYKAIRIRSDKPFKCSLIYWYDHDLK